MSQEENNPLSCHLGNHFVKTVGNEWICMYCGHSNTLEAHNIIKKHYLQENPLTPKDVLLRNVEKE